MIYFRQPTYWENANNYDQSLKCVFVDTEAIDYKYIKQTNQQNKKHETKFNKQSKSIWCWWWMGISAAPALNSNWKKIVPTVKSTPNVFRVWEKISANDGSGFSEIPFLTRSTRDPTALCSA